MKVIYTIAFVVVSAAIIYLGNKAGKAAVTLVRQRKTDYLKTGLLSSLILSLFFVQFWLLSQSPFPYLILLLLIAASFIALPIYEFIGSITGFTIKEKRSKINLLYTVFAFQQGLNHPRRALLLQLTGYLILISWVAALTIFWLHPLGYPDVSLWAAVLIFIVPQISNIINSLNSILPTVVSEYVDDDLRNANLSQNFSSVIYSTIFFIFPFYILKQEFAEKISWLPPYWVLISIPLILFFLLAIIPFFMGLNKHHNQKEYFLQWQKDWLSRFKNTLYITNEENKTAIQNQQLLELQNEISARTDEDKINGFFKELETYPISSTGNLTQQEEIFLLLKENENNIKKWNLKLSFITRLQETSDNITSLRNSGPALKEYITDMLEDISSDIDGIDKNKNRLAGILTAALTALIGFIFKTYQEDILKLIKNFYH